MSKKQHSLRLSGVQSSDEESHMDTNNISTATTTPAAFNTSSNSAFVSTANSGKPTASVTPVLKQDINSNSFSVSSGASSSTSTSSVCQNRLTTGGSNEVDLAGNLKFNKDKTLLDDGTDSDRNFDERRKQTGVFNGLNILKDQEESIMGDEPMEVSKGPDVVNCVVNNCEDIVCNDGHTESTFNKTGEDYTALDREMDNQSDDCVKMATNKPAVKNSTVNNHICASALDSSSLDNTLTKTVEALSSVAEQTDKHNSEMDIQVAGKSLTQDSDDCVVESVSKLSKLGISRRSSRSSSCHQSECSLICEWVNLIYINLRSTVAFCHIVICVQ